VTPLGALARGLAAGVAGTAAMTGLQELVGLVRGGDGKPPRRWADTPAPAQIGRRLLEGVFEQRVTLKRAPLLTHLFHWGYGTALGGAYGLVQGTVRTNPWAMGLGFGAAAWALSYVELVPMGLQKPPWEYEPKTIAVDVSYHVVYGLGVAGAFELLD
jgi:hypothetical protein